MATQYSNMKSHNELSLHFTFPEIELWEKPTADDRICVYLSVNSNLVDIINVPEAKAGITIPIGTPLDEIQIFFKNLHQNEVIGSITFQMQLFIDFDPGNYEEW